MTFSRGYVENLARGSSPTSMAIMKRQVYEQLHRGLGEAEYDSQRSDRSRASGAATSRRA